MKEYIITGLLALAASGIVVLAIYGAVCLLTR